MRDFQTRVYPLFSGARRIPSHVALCNVWLARFPRLEAARIAAKRRRAEAEAVQTWINRITDGPRLVWLFDLISDHELFILWILLPRGPRQAVTFQCPPPRYLDLLMERRVLIQLGTPLLDVRFLATFLFLLVSLPLKLTFCAHSAATEKHLYSYA